MAEKKNLCAMIPLPLHQRVREEQDKAGLSLSDYVTAVLTEYFEGGKSQMNGKTRTLAFQVSEELFQKVKSYLADHSGLTQRDFVVRLIEQAIAEWEAENEREAAGGDGDADAGDDSEAGYDDPPEDEVP